MIVTIIIVTCGESTFSCVMREHNVTWDTVVRLTKSILHQSKIHANILQLSKIGIVYMAFSPTSNDCTGRGDFMSSGANQH